jgi:3-isopropylmalate/(R)-2-methylmalate dehydratase small subunit
MSRAHTGPALRRSGRCHVFGDAIPMDEGVMAFEYVIKRITDPQVLIPELFRHVDPEFARRVEPGDIVVAGRDFGCGKPHGTGFIAMQALGLGILCESMPTRSHRNAVSRGVPILADCAGVRGLMSTGDRIEVDYVSGAVRNLTTGAAADYAGMPPVLLDIVRAGGTTGFLRHWLETHPELGAATG